MSNGFVQLSRVFHGIAKTKLSIGVIGFQTDRLAAPANASSCFP